MRNYSEEEEDHERGCVIKEDVIWLKVSAYHKFLFGLKEHAPSAMDDWSAVRMCVNTSFRNAFILLTWVGLQFHTLVKILVAAVGV